MVQPGAENDHRAAVGLFRIGGELAGDMDDVVARHAGDVLRPRRGERLVLVIIQRDVVATEAAVEAVIGADQVEHRGDQGVSVAQGQAADGNVTHKNVRMFGGGEAVGGGAAEIREGHRCRRVVSGEGQSQLHLATGAFLGLQVPFALFAPAEANRAERHDGGAVLVERHRLPGGVVGFTEVVGKILGAQQAFGDIGIALAHQAHEHRQIGGAPRVILEIRHAAIEEILAQDHVAERQSEGGIGALLRVQPEIGELGGLGVIRRHHHALGALVANLGVEMRVRRAGLRHVGAPDHQVAGVVPVSAFGNVGLFAPGHRAGRRQVAIPVVKAHADAAEQ